MLRGWGVRRRVEERVGGPLAQVVPEPVSRRTVWGALVPVVDGTVRERSGGEGWAVGGRWMGLRSMDEGGFVEGGERLGDGK